MDNEEVILEERGSHGPRVSGLSEAERKLLTAAAAGDTASVNDILIYGRRQTLDVDCRDALGRCAVELAVDGEHLDVAEVLLHYGAKPGEALMYAVDKEDVPAIEKLLKYSNNKDNSPSVAYPPEMTPIILACHKNSLPVIKCLVNNERLITEPDKCSSNFAATDAVFNIYRGLASPYYILLTNDDPLKRAFVLSKKLDELEDETPELEEGFSKMAGACRSLGEDLLDLVRNRDEAEAILNCGDDTSPLVHGESSQMKLSRLDMAVDLQQKKFVTDRWSQRLVKECWYGPYFKPTNRLAEYLRAFLLMLFSPILALVYIVAPTTKAGQFIRTPAVRFAMYLESYATFLILVFLRAEKVGFDGPRGGELAPPPTIPEWLMIIWIAGMLVEEIRLIWKLGVRNCLSDVLGVNSWSVITLYLAVIILRIAAYIYHGGPQLDFRFTWYTYDPTLIAEALAAIGGVVAFSRLLPLLTMDQYLGPMTLSMLHMVKDIIKFFIIFCIIVITFSSGLNELYSFYSRAVIRRCEDPRANNTSPLKYTTCTTNNAFGDFGSSFAELFWSLFGLGSKDTLSLSLNEAANPGGEFMEHTLTMYVGKSLYGLYLVVAAVILLNMLIAMMGNSYSEIANNESSAWRFEVTRIMLRYIRDEPTLPMPFNLIPTPKFIYNKIIKPVCARRLYKSELDLRDRAKKENHRRYKEVMSRLVRRYLLIHEREKGNEPIFGDFTPTVSDKGSARTDQNDAPVGSAQPLERVKSNGSSTLLVNPGADVPESTYF